MRINGKVNKVFYITFGIAHLLLLIYTFYKNEDRKRLFVLFNFYIGLAYMFEYVINSLFNSYTYRPKLFREKYIDNYIGAIFSQFFYVPSTALFITAFGLGWKSKLFFSLYFTAVEKLFLYLNIFKNNWWKTRYTFILTFASFLTNDLWYKLLKNRNALTLFISFVHTILVIKMNTGFLLAATRQIRYGMGSVLSLKEHFKITPFIDLLQSLFLAICLKVPNVNAMINSFFFMLVTDLLLLKNGNLKIKKLFVLPIMYGFIITSSVYFRKLVYQPSNKSKIPNF